MATVSQQNQSSGVSMMPLIVFGVLSLIFGFFMWLVLPSLGVLPIAASQEAQNTDNLFRILLGIGGVVFFLVQGLIYYAAIAFRAPANDSSDGPNLHGNMLLEIVWTIVPSVVVVFLAIASYLVWVDNTSVSETPNVVNGDSIVINAYGQRFAWSFEYITNANKDVLNPDGTVSAGAGDRVIFTSPNLYVYAAQDVFLQMETRDVIHSFWSPEMRVKQDLLPGRVTEMRFTPIDPQTGWDAVMVVSPVTLYAAADFGSEVVFEELSDETDFGTVAHPVELDLVDSNVSFPALGESPKFIEVVTADGTTGYLSVSSDMTISRFNRYRIICAELCGGGHGDMFTQVVMFESREGFETTWYTPTVAINQQPAGNPIDYAERVFGTYGCSGCHTLSSLGWAAVTGPSLDGIGALAGSRVEDASAQSGNELVNGAEYLAQSIRHPQEYFVPGYTALMRVFDPATMPQEDLNAIVAYLCTETGSSPAASTCGLENWSFDEQGRFDGDTSALVNELMIITDEYQN